MEESISILKVDAAEPIKSIQDIKDNIKILKDNLGELTIGTDEYKQTLKDLKVNQNALRDAMYGTTASLDDIQGAAKGVGESYNALVHHMASLKEELRATDVSTEQGRKRFEELAKEIDQTNDKLKKMDELQGNFQRNVGNYPGTFKKWSSALDGLDKGLKAATHGVGGMKNASDALGKSPMFVMVGILVTSLGSLVSKFKESEEGTKAMQAGMANLEPILNILQGLVGKLGEWLGKGIEKLGELAKNSEGTFKSVLAGAVGVGNALKEYLLTPIRVIIDAAKGLGETMKHVFKGEFKEAAESARTALGNIGEDFKKGFSFKDNYQVGKEVGDAFVGGLATAKPAVQEVTNEIKVQIKDDLEEIAKEIERAEAELFASIDKEALEEIARAKVLNDARLKGLQAAYEHRKNVADIEIEDERERAATVYDLNKQANEKRLALLEQFKNEALERGDLSAYLDYEQQAADLSVTIEENAMRERKRLRELDLKDEEAKAKAKQQLMQAVVSGTSSMLSSLASLLESDEENAEKNAEAIKALRISGATIDTISGAIGAYMQAAASIPPPAGIIVGAIQAATVTAAGIANIAKIKNTQVGSANASASLSASAGSGAITNAPTLTTQVANVRTLTSATEEERLNQMASAQRVYIVASDIQASQDAIRTQVVESSF